MPGHTLVLSIDLDLQQAAEQALGDHAGAIVALDPRNGDVLAMVSEPSFDPNALHRRHQRRACGASCIHASAPSAQRPRHAGAVSARLDLQDHRRHGGARGGHRQPLHPHSLSRLRSPSATTTSAAGSKGGHGSMNVHDALVSSCDVFFYQVGAAPRHRHASPSTRAPSGSALPTGIEIGNERVGDRFPTRAWKKTRFQQPWYAGRDAVGGHRPGLRDGDAAADGGGGGDRSPPACATGRVWCSASRRSTARVVREIAARAGGAGCRCATRCCKQVQEALVDVVGARHRQEGARCADITVGGKTGTSQVVTHRQRAPQGEPVEVEPARPRLVRRLRAGRGSDHRGRDAGRARRGRRRRGRGADRARGARSAYFQPAGRAQEGMRACSELTAACWRTSSGRC